MEHGVVSLMNRLQPAGSVGVNHGGYPIDHFRPGPANALHVLYLGIAWNLEEIRRGIGDEDPEEWLSARPPDYDALKNLSPPEQVVWQLVSLNAKMEADISNLGSTNVMRLNYETFCDQPELVIEMLRSSFAKTRTRNPAQEGFKRSKQGPRNNEEETLVRLVVNADL